MEPGKEEITNLNSAADASANGGGDGFIDRSKVRILLCDHNSSSSEEVYTLLLKCSYQVTSVGSARQVIDALNSEGADIDIILAEVDLPMKKGMRMLKYITRHKDLRRIPVIMMSEHDEVTTVVKCLRFGAADYLVKPLRTNELLTLWTHMWRRRRMLGLAEKNLLNYELDPVVSDPSDATTSSTTLFSDDTNDKSRKDNHPDTVTSTLLDNETVVAAGAVAVIEPLHENPWEYRPDVPGITGTHQKISEPFSAGPNKSELKIGESSAFFTYVKSSPLKNIAQGVADPIKEKELRIENEMQACGQQAVADAQVQENVEAWESYSQGDEFRSSTSIPDSLSLGTSCTPPGSGEYPKFSFKEENLPQNTRQQINEFQHHATDIQPQNGYSYYMHGVMNQVMMQSSTQLYQNNMHELHGQVVPTVLPQHNHFPQHITHMPGLSPFPYYPVNMCLQPGQMLGNNSWQPSFGSSPAAEPQTNKVDRREAALMKFRQKRKERCFDKKIRYVNRKKLAERRPRVRGQFIRKFKGVDVDLNGHPTGTDYEDEEEDDDELALRDCSPEDEAS
ncbi:Two-component response regulator-like APRR1 [Linum perenne]